MAQGECTARERGGRMLREAGYHHAEGGKVTMPRVKRTVKRAIHEHETEEHGGKHGQIKLRRGGKVPGHEPAERPDKRARGGKVGKGKTIININAGGGGDDQKEMAAHQAGMQQGAQAVVAKLAGAQGGAGGPPRPPMAPPPGGSPMPPGGPPGAMPPRPMGPPGAGPMARGGAMHRRDEHGRFSGGAV